MPFYQGEHTCSARKKKGDPCTQPAYYVLRDNPVCGRHNDKTLGRKMKRNPAALEQRAEALRQHAASVARAAEANARAGVPGSVSCCKMRMMRPVPLPEGAQLVFPNRKHGGRVDGLGMTALSPMTIGPIRHPQPGLPPARNLENFHQGSKWFPTQTFEEYRATQRQMFEDPVPHRHHQEAKKIPAGRNRNIPRCFAWTRADGTVVEYSYVASRQFYCCYMERALLAAPDFIILQGLLAAGTNICLCGYDAYQPADATPIEACYLDPARPFGHEMVIYTMLRYTNATEWPWRKYVTEEF